MKKIFLLSFFLITNKFAVKAQTYEKTAIGIKANINGAQIEIQGYSPFTVRVIKTPSAKPLIKKSLSVIQNPSKNLYKITSNNDLVLLKSSAIQVSLDLKSGEVTFENNNGDELLKEKANGAQFNPFNDAGNETFNISQSFKLTDEEAIYGLGQLQNGKINQRNQSYNLTTGNTDDGIPFFQSTKGYGVFWDNYSATVFKDDKSGTSFKSEVGDAIDYYFMYGGNADGVIGKMRELTGEAPMFPLWTYGYWQSKERYKSQEEIVDVVKKYRDLKVPIDGIIQDWQYWGDNYHWNGMSFLNPAFPNPKKMIDDIHNMDAHAIISIWSSFGPQTEPYKVLDTKKMLFNFQTWPQSGKETWPPDMNYPSGVRVYDAYNPEARDIYWDFANKGIFKLGIDGWWMDSTEPDHLNAKPEDFDTQTYLGSYRKVRNAYPLMAVGGMYTHQRSASSDKRVFILTRSAFAGQQRFGANTWSGDVTASWNALKNQISTGVNFSLTGIPYWNSDIGGFFLSNFRKKLADPEYRELYVRWLEFGAFTPMMRSHGADAPREIYQFGEKGNRTFDAIEKFIKLRYSLLPYIYSTSWDVTAHQSSMMRGLMMDFVNDKNVLNINDQYLFGKSIMVAPVTEAMYVKKGSDNVNQEDFSTVKSRKVYLPKGADWYDFWTNEKIGGGQTISKDVPLDILPLYVKSGTILPIGPEVQFAEEKKWDNLELKIYPGADGEFVMYEDENDNYNYEKGKYSTIHFSWNDKKKKLTIDSRSGEFSGMLLQRKFKVVLIEGKSIGSLKNIQTANYGGEKLKLKFQ